MKVIGSFLIIFFFFQKTNAQDASTDTVELQEVVVNAFNNKLSLIKVGAAISLVSPADLNRFSNNSILPSLNMKPGIRMEERSPGSYRLSIRGSSLRSPFGVRNVKVYYNGIPYTDPGGNTFLNQLGFYNIQSMEIIRGPGSSLYGAGTGGVLLARSTPDVFTPGVSLDYTAGSYNMQSVHGSIRLGNAESNHTVSFQHLSNDGYRDHTNMRRDVFSWDAVMKQSSSGKLTTHFLYADIFYQTPGGLNQSEFENDPKSARPAAGPFPGSKQAKAAIYNKTFLAGLVAENKIGNNWENTTSIYGAYSQLRNPAVRNYGRTTEPHFGGRTVFSYIKNWSTSKLTLNSGIEFQQSYNTQRIYDNNNGEPDSLQSDDEINNTQQFIFLQGTLELENEWVITSGASLNSLSLDFRRLSDVPSQERKRTFQNEWMPRISLLRKLGIRTSAYLTVARGFSAPTTAEVLPSTNIFNTTLQGETGWNYEAGLRGNILKNKFYFDINAFYFRLQNAIVQRRDASGADYFENAGSANQQGIESFFSYTAIKKDAGFLKNIKINLSSTINNFKYKTFKRLNDDFSGNTIPGVAKNTIAAGLDAYTRPGLYANLTYFQSGKIFLNDANTAVAEPYHIATIRVGIKRVLVKKTIFDFYAGIDNLLDETYSLGNDINAANGRYYNAAARRNFYAGLRFDFH